MSAVRSLAIAALLASAAQAAAQQSPQSYDAPMRLVRPAAPPAAAPSTPDSATPESATPDPSAPAPSDAAPPATPAGSASAAAGQPLVIAPGATTPAPPKPDAPAGEVARTVPVPAVAPAAPGGDDAAPRPAQAAAVALPPRPSTIKLPPSKPVVTVAALPAEAPPAEEPPAEGQSAEAPSAVVAAPAEPLPMAKPLAAPVTASADDADEPLAVAAPAPETEGKAAEPAEPRPPVRVVGPATIIAQAAPDALDEPPPPAEQPAADPPPAAAPPVASPSAAEPPPEMPPADVAAGLPPVIAPVPADLPPPVQIAEPEAEPATDAAEMADERDPGERPPADVAAGLPPLIEPAPADLPPPQRLAEPAGDTAAMVDERDPGERPPADVAAGLPPLIEPVPADLPPPMPVLGPATVVTADDFDAMDELDEAQPGDPPPSGVAAGLPPVMAPVPADLPPPVSVVEPVPEMPTAAMDDAAPIEAPPAPPPAMPAPEDTPAPPAEREATVPAAEVKEAEAAPAPATTSGGNPVHDIAALIRDLIGDPIRQPAPPIAGDRLVGSQEAQDAPDTVETAFPAETTIAEDGAELVLRPGPAEGSPVRLVRQLQQLQDQMAQGTAGALRRQRVLLDRIETDFRAAAPAVWQEPANAHALVTFVLSGGNPAPLRDVLGRTPKPPIDERLMGGVLAYVEGREEAAAELLSGVDVLTVPSGMGAQLALAKAALAVATDTPLAIGMLDTARLLAPGTLAEEAALRREIFVVSQTADIDKFELLSAQYLTRFRYSVYAGNFRQRFAAALTRMDFVDNRKEFPRLDDMVADLDIDSQREIYLLVARSAVNRGLTTAATLAAERAMALSDPGSVDAARGRLYRAAVLVVTPAGLDAGLDDLAAIDPRRLPPDDAALHQAASSTAKLILTAPILPEPTLPPPAPRLPANPETAGADPMPEVASRAQDALATVDALLKGAR